MDKGLEKYESEIELDQAFSQIFIRTSPYSTLALARKVIEKLNIRILEVKYILPNILLLKLDVKDVREATLKLAENGFSDIKGFNASFSQI